MAERVAERLRELAARLESMASSSVPGSASASMLLGAARALRESSALLAGQAEQIERLTRDRDNLRDALQQIADSYPWQPFASDEVIRIGGAVRGWTNRRIARAALRAAAVGGDNAACVCPGRPCPVHAPGMTDLMVRPECIDEALASSPAWAVREYEDLRDDFLTLRKASIEARRALWWFIERSTADGEWGFDDSDVGKICARAMAIQDDILGAALAAVGEDTE